MSHTSNADRLNAEKAQLRKTLDRRYDELKSGDVKPIDGEEAFALLLSKNDSAHNSGLRTQD
jgi:hypothetical protein